MGINKFKEEIPEEQGEVIETHEDAELQKQSSAKPRKKKKNFFWLISHLDYVDKNRIVHAMPFILFLTVIAMVYITNSFYAERTIRDIDRTKKELKERRAEFISTKSKLMINSMQSEVAQHAVASSFDIKESTVPPKKIIISDKEKRNQQ